MNELYFFYHPTIFTRYLSNELKNAKDIWAEWRKTTKRLRSFQTARLKVSRSRMEISWSDSIKCKPYT